MQFWCACIHDMLWVSFIKSTYETLRFKLLHVMYICTLCPKSLYLIRSKITLITGGVVGAGNWGREDPHTWKWDIFSFVLDTAYANLQQKSLPTRAEECLNKKDLSDSSAGCIFCEQHYNEGLKYGVFSYLISRYKYCGPKKTNFMDFGQKLAILQLFYKK